MRRITRLLCNCVNVYFFETGDQQNLEVGVHIHQGTPDLVAGIGCLDPEVVTQVFLLVH